MRSDDHDDLKLENQLCFPLYVCSREVVRRYRPFLDPLGITYTQYVAMMALWEKGSMTVRDLGTELHLDSGTLTPLLRKLEEKGFVVRSRDADDERSVIVTVTDMGYKLREDAERIPESVKDCIQLPEEDMLVLHRILRDLMTTFP